MRFPSQDDTILAVSSGWEASAVGIVRLSGPRAFELATVVGVLRLENDESSYPACADVRILVDEGLQLPATAYWFRAPRSYTGQDVVELHTVGSLPALRALCGRLIDAGARRALGGEFTARAFLNGKLTADRVDGVLALIHADDETAARRAARAVRDSQREALDRAADELLDLIALIEAGIDFTEEEDIHFITSDECRRRIASVRSILEGIGVSGGSASLELPHVALAGAPNAGKSTLFNALLGAERAIVSPVVGTTRDVLSAEVRIGGRRVVLQDCAGLGASTDEIELASHLLAEQAADRADVILWVHDGVSEWTDDELRACRRVPRDRRMLVISKSDLGPSAVAPPTDFSATVRISAATNDGLDDLRAALSQRIDAAQSEGGADAETVDTSSIVEILVRSEKICDSRKSPLFNSELISFELRDAWDRISRAGSDSYSEQVLGRIFTRFCVGK